jgi:hypothetical protein
MATDGVRGESERKGMSKEDHPAFRNKDASNNYQEGDNIWDWFTRLVEQRIQQAETEVRFWEIVEQEQRRG